MLKRDISGFNVLVAAAGGMIGSGWLFSPFISAQIAGSHALISWILAALFMLFIALPLCELGAMFPVSGGMSNYPTYTHGDEVGFLFAWTSWLSYVVMTPIEIQAILQYGSHFFPALLVKHAQTFTLSPIGYVFAFFIMLGVVLMNSFGIRLLAECNKYASIIKFILPGIAIFALMGQAHWSNLSFHLNEANSWKAIFSALSTGGIAFAFTGFQNGLMLAGEVQNPQHNIPLAILGAVLVGFVLYFLLQLSFLVAIPPHYLEHGWAGLSFPGDSGPLVGLTLLLGLSVVATLLMFDAVFSPFGTTLVYTAATSRILYGMAQNRHLPQILLKTNGYQIPYLTLWINFAVGLFSFLPFPGWQKMVAFLSSCSILSYGIGPICLLALRKTTPDIERPFRLKAARFVGYASFYFCNLMLYWCGYDIIWKLMLAMILGLLIHIIVKKRSFKDMHLSLYWFLSYLAIMMGFSYLSEFGGIGSIVFPYDLFLLFPISCVILYTSSMVLEEKSAADMKEFVLSEES